MTIKLSNQDLDTGKLPQGKRPAIIAVDLSNGFAQANSPLGGDFSGQIAANITLFEAANKSGVPIFFSTVVYDSPDQASVFRQRLPALNILQRGSHWIEIHDDLQRFVANDNIIEKHHPSAFFNTNLIDKLRFFKVDSLIITGLTTSGCVRATCVDGLQHNFLCSVIPQACGDRNQKAHDMSLHDMHAKYAQVINIDDSLQWLSCLNL